MANPYASHNIVVKNKKSKIPQLLTPNALKELLKDPKLNKTIDILGAADDRGRLIKDSKKEMDAIYKPLIVTKVGVIVPVEELKPNKDQGNANKEEMD